MADNMTSLADKLQNLELCLKSQHSREIGYGRALREAILSMDLFMELEVLKSLGDLHLHKGKLCKDLVEFDKAAALYAAAFLRCTDPDMGQTLSHRIDYMEKLSRQLLQGYTPQYQWLSPDYWGTADSNVLRVAEICNKLDRGVGRLWQSVEESYTETLVTAIGKGDTFLEVEVLKSLGDFYLEKGKTTNGPCKLSKAAASYDKALTRCDDPETKQTLHHRVLYTVKIWGTVRARRQSSSNKSRKRGRRSPTRRQFGNNKFPDATQGSHPRQEVLNESSYQDHLQEGCRALQTGDLDTAEQHFAAALKSVHFKFSKSDQHIKEAEPLYKLGDVYLKRGIQSKDGGDFTKAAALCNAALVRCRREDIKEAIQEISRSFLKHVLNIDQKVDAGDAEKHKLKLDEHRDFVKEEIKRIEQEVDPYSLADDDPKIREVEKRRADEIRTLFDTIVHQRKMFIAGLVDECMELMGPPPYPVDNWFYDSVTPRGFAFDGSMPHASKTPLGRGRNSTSTSELIRTPREMTKVLEDDLRFHLKKGYHLASILGNVCLITGEQELVDVYIALWTQKLQENHGGVIPCLLHEALTHLSENVRMFQNDVKPGRLMDVKKEMYRFSSLAVSCLALLRKIQPTTIWETIQHLNKTGTVSCENTHHLMVMVSISAELRLRTYISNGGQVESMSALSPISPDTHIGETLKKVFYFSNTKQLMRYYCTERPTKRLISQLADGHSSEESSILFDDSSSVKAEVYRSLCDYENCKTYAEQALQSYISRYGEGNPHPYIAGSLNNLGEAWSELGDHRKAVRYYKQSLKMKQSIYGENTVKIDIASLLANLGAACSELGDYKNSVSYLEQSLQMMKAIYGENTEHGDIADSLNNLGAACSKLGDYRKAVIYHEQSLQMRWSIYGDNTEHPDIATSLTNLGVTFSNLGNYRKAVTYYEQSLQMQQSIYGENTEHPAISYSLHNLGNTCNKLGDYRKAISYLQGSLKMMKAIYGENIEHPDIATCFNNLGVACTGLGDYRKAVSYFEQSLEMKQSIYGENTEHPVFADSLKNLGSAYNDLGDYRKAVSYHEQSLKMRQSIYGENTEHPDIATCLNNLGVACTGLGDYRKAVSYFEQSLEMKQSIYGENTEHPVFADSLNNLGSAYNDLGDYRKAVSYHEQSLKMRQSIYGGNTEHPDIAYSLNNMSTACSNLGDHKNAVSYYEQSLQMRQSIYVVSNAHPDIVTSLNNLAVTWGSLGDHRKADNYRHQARRMREVIEERNKAQFHTG
ncbi:PREDICTED: uncharacterized protein LOC109481317 [Branchiostoma belcheri]|uniref:Uncharacterized protein LOC109481317 n=1 Tax=Branchiostoma belcheri TaxID=7741 RepID=A0A6P4ZRF3_BRABE|nr:PREDICTED: uncharacterized protein LOC109481317 [Branchiostoma belcheri]